MKYLADNRPDRLPQTQPMSVGSAFDAFAKSYIHNALFGNYGANNEYEKEAIFESQVEPQNRDWARVAGKHVFERYCHSGAMADMMIELQKSIAPPRFEFNIEGVVSSSIGNIPLLGKPDIFFINAQGARVIWDWKVNGYCSNSATSPTKGYVKCRDSWNTLEKKSSRGAGSPHKEAVLMDHLGITINGAMMMEDCNAEWADQLAIYSWLLGEDIGSENVIIGIDQIVGSGADTVDKDGRPYLRIASHRTRISSKYQFLLHERLTYVWNAISSGHLYGEVSREASDAKIKELEQLATALSSDDEFAQFINQHCRSQ